jgi:hypothetical protein
LTSIIHLTGPLTIINQQMGPSTSIYHLTVDHKSRPMTSMGPQQGSLTTIGQRKRQTTIKSPEEAIDQHCPSEEAKPLKKGPSITERGHHQQSTTTEMGHQPPLKGAINQH